MIAVRLERPWLWADLSELCRVLSWAPHRPGFVMARHVAWREVRNADLSEEFDVETWFQMEMAPYSDAIGMLTSRDIGTFKQARVTAGGVTADCVATVGLTNGESVGRRRPFGPMDFGTINLCVEVDFPMTEAAQLEAMSIAVQARTAAVLAAQIDFGTGSITGTGTDCVAVACPPGEHRYAGLHTAAGEAVGAAVRRAVAAGVADWQRWFAAEQERRSR